MKRLDYISWDEYFMGIAILSSKRSKDPSTQVGACIVRNNKILSVGYNGFPIGCSDDILPWDRNGEYENTKYPYVVHAEINAILNSHTSLIDSTLYVTLFPCVECAKAIIQSGIKKVFYLEHKYKDNKEFIASERLLNLANISIEKIDVRNKKIELEF